MMYIWAREVMLAFYSTESNMMCIGKGSEAGILFNRIVRDVYVE